MPIRRTAGFTLVEVLVALVVMATMAMMAWRGIDALLKTRDIAQGSLEQSARLQTVMAQWEQDLRAVRDGGYAIGALQFDGANLRILRQHPQGMQVVTWSVRDGALWRWESQPVQTLAALEEAAQRGLQFIAQDRQRLRAIEGVSGWQMYYYRGDSWSNAQSSDDTQTAEPPPPSGTPPPKAGGETGAPATGGTPPPGPTAPPPSRSKMPTGVRMVLEFAPGSGFGGPLTRQIELVMDLS